MSTSIAVDVRGVLKTAIGSVAANVYDFVPESPQVPFAAIVPSAPYMEAETIGRSKVRVKLNYRISVGVAYLSNAASLDNLEKLTMAILAVLPAGYEISVVEQPSVTLVGASNLLTNDIRLSVRYEHTI